MKIPKLKAGDIFRMRNGGDTHYLINVMNNMQLRFQFFVNKKYSDQLTRQFLVTEGYFEWLTPEGGTSVALYWIHAGDEI